MKIFIICPVRSATPLEKAILDQYVEHLEEQGHSVHYPPRDTNQNDPVGFDICCQNRLAIELADRVDIFYNPTSSGSLFDIGMTFMLRKNIKLINTVLRTDGKKGFNNVLLELERRSIK
jgi:hypothetical protein